MKYEMRIQAVLAADDDGTNAATVSADGFKQRVDAANAIYAAADIQFLFDPKTDLLTLPSTLINRSITILDHPDVKDNGWSREPRVDRASHHRARTALAHVFPRKIVVFCRQLTTVDRVQMNPPVWRVKGIPNSSSWSAWYVNLSQEGAGITTLAHELGHYLQIRHTFSGPDTVAEARAAIKQAVDAGTVTIGSGLVALDGDRVWVTDTVPDCRPGIFADAGVDLCGASGVPLAVDFGEAGVKNYELKPDRLNLMSYHQCPGTKTISAQQARRVHDGLEIGMRQRLVGFRATRREVLSKKGAASAGKVSALDVTAVRHGRFVTVLRNGAGKLELICWDVSDAGVITRRGEATAGNVKLVRSCALGLGLIATAVRTAGDQIKLIIWQVGSGGAVTRKQDATVITPGLEFAICRTGIEYVATAVRGGGSDNLRVDVWKVTAFGALSKVTGASGDVVEGPVSGSITAFPVSGAGFATAIVRPQGKSVLTSVWHHDAADLTRQDDLVLPGGTTTVAGCAVDRELAAIATRTSAGRLEVVAVGLPGDGAHCDERAHGISNDAITNPAICRVGGEHIVTAADVAGNATKLVAWNLSRDGDAILQRDDLKLPDVTSPRLCQTGDRQVIVAGTTPAGNLTLASVELRAPFSLNLPSHFAPVLEDSLVDVFRGVQVDPRQAFECEADDVQRLPRPLRGRATNGSRVG